MQNIDELEKIVTDVLGRLCDNKEFDSATKLIDSGIVDSLVIVELVMELESILNIDIDLDLITIENFNSVESIVDMLSNMD